jgi:hypothetical protein
VRYKHGLIISDTHAPDEHLDTIPFLKSVLKEFDLNPKKHFMCHIGDETNGQGWHFHGKGHQSLPNSDQEFEQGLKFMQKLYAIFPYMEVLKSNHGSLAERQAQATGIPSYWLRNYKDAYEAPDGWQWHDWLRITLDNGEPLNLVHGLGSNVWNEALKLGESLIQGHHHTKLFTHSQYMQNLKCKIQAMQVGCLINDKSRVFDYNKILAERPKIGCGVIKNNILIPVPLYMKANGRWTGSLKP